MSFFIILQECRQKWDDLISWPSRSYKIVMSSLIGKSSPPHRMSDGRIASIPGFLSTNRVWTLLIHSWLFLWRRGHLMVICIDKRDGAWLLVIDYIGIGICIDWIIDYQAEIKAFWICILPTGPPLILGDTSHSFIIWSRLRHTPMLRHSKCEYY